MQTFTSLSDKERNWVQAHVDLSRKIVGAYVGGELAVPPTAAQLDAAWSQWIESDGPVGENAERMVTVFGLAFGQALVDGLKMEWTIVTDEYGTDVGVLGQPGDLVAFPKDAVTKRWKGREAGFFVPLYGMFKERRLQGTA